ncbi:hypothetical protein BJX65DRAFT_298006 [Aspergillus insuetus]
MFLERPASGLHTHRHYQTDIIDPETFKFLAASAHEELDPDLKVFMAVGGWTFNNPGPTATVFLDIAWSKSNQKAFFKSLISFMSTYNFNSIDLNWEYPVANDQSGRPKDFKNFPKFMANLKKALKASGGRDGLSITLPASYWYLQHFDIAKLQKSVNFFNIMSYDLHGAWDGHSKWLEPQLNSHTNLTEITNTLDLLWRNNIDPNNVVLGLAFYARVFAASSPSCMEPGCLFQSGGNAGIIKIMETQDVKPTFNKDAAWLTYDNTNIFKLKVQFASSQCLGGVMVWAVSHDLPHGNYSRALGEAANRKVTAIALPALLEEDVNVYKVNKQCKWTNCLDGCPSGWTHVGRSDDGTNGEAIIDHNNCPTGTDHFFCCPPNSPVPTCGWYHHRNGNCNGKANCPSGMLEVRSNMYHCQIQAENYEVACCTYQNIPSMKLYKQCDITQIVNSSTGSGGHLCNNCPTDSVRVGLHVTQPCDSGGRVACYKPKYHTLNTHEDKYTDEIKRIKKSLKEFLGNPVCPREVDPFGYKPLDALSLRWGPDLHFLHHRASSKAAIDDVHILLYTLTFVAAPPTTSQMMELWVLYISPAYKNVTLENIRNYAQEWWNWANTQRHEFITIIMCNFEHFNNMWGGNKHNVLNFARVSRRPIEITWPDGSEDTWRALGVSFTHPVACLLSFASTFSPPLARTAEKAVANSRWPQYTFGYLHSGFCASGAYASCPHVQAVPRGHLALTTKNVSFPVKHKIELKTIGIWAEHGTHGSLPSGKSAPANLPPIPLAYATTHLRSQVLVNPPPKKGGATGHIPLNQIFNALGSTRNNGGFVLLKEGLNSAKGKVLCPLLLPGCGLYTVELTKLNYEQMWNGHYPTDTDKTKALAKNTHRASAEEVLKRIREVAGVISYINYPANQAAIVQEAHDAETEICLADDSWVANGNPEREIGVKWWRQRSAGIRFGMGSIDY